MAGCARLCLGIVQIDSAMSPRNFLLMSIIVTIFTFHIPVHHQVERYGLEEDATLARPLLHSGTRAHRYSRN